MVGVTLWLTGDVMTGRGIDQILSHPGEPRIFESCMASASGYVRLAERVNGPIPHPVDFAYAWGDALAWLERQAPDLRLINLETAVTTSDYAEPKGIQYRMHPANLPVLAAAGVDACVLANNHVLDWGRRGLRRPLRYSARRAISRQVPALTGIRQGARHASCSPAGACGCWPSGFPAAACRETGRLVTPAPRASFRARRRCCESAVSRSRCCRTPSVSR
ncbi:Bacterial capsule synthesis protein PGA_cap [Halomonas lysinitropha]|uniref:Bacterial capsule synthesis protein PGA_cap n=1 Tax=Halomonas lysinitropha TaxID=2607506 RepID=A0A5K1I1J6_9GAMM|nr:Bacterial capsule synthesis protein PGA_cap [Halomonas lysinitropha]